MRILNNGEGRPGVSCILFEEADFKMLVDRTAKGDPLERARAAVADFKSICTGAARAALLESKPPELGGWTRRHLTARRVACCMELCSQLHLETGNVTVSVITQPGCDGSGETTPYPDRDMAEGCAGLLSQIMSRD